MCGTVVMKAEMIQSWGWEMVVMGERTGIRG